MVALAIINVVVTVAIGLARRIGRAVIIVVAGMLYTVSASIAFFATRTVIFLVVGYTFAITCNVSIIANAIMVVVVTVTPGTTRRVEGADKVELTRFVHTISTSVQLLAIGAGVVFR